MEFDTPQTQQAMSSSQPSPAEQPATPALPSAPQGQAQAQVPAKAPRVLACKLCQHRKIKCDRTFPCANCTKSNQRCEPSHPAPARKRKKPNQDLQERLADLEAKMWEAGFKIDTDVKPKRSNGTGESPGGDGRGHNGVHPHLSPHGRLVKEDGGQRFMDSAILGTIYDELRAMRESLAAETNDEPTPDPVVPDENSELFVGADTPSSTTPEDLWPEPQHVFRLWKIYLERVNPLTKIIHVPTLTEYVAQAGDGCSNLPKNIEALLFSIWLMAVVAMTPDECQACLGCSKDDALHRFGSGVRMAMIRLNFLQTPDMTTLQALVIYLISLQGRYNRHAAWILNGVVIRIAQKMGLHRDGTTLKLGPFDTEMRRRLWWQIIMLDAKYALMTGLNNASLPRVWDTKEPKNLDDTDIYPQATEEFKDKEGPTEMIFVMITNKVARFLVETPDLELMLMLAEWPAAPATPNPRLSNFRTKIAKLGQDLLQMLEKYCDPNAGTVHQMAVEVKQQIIKKLQAFTVPAKEHPEWGSEIMDSKDNAFKLAVCGLEHEQENCLASQNKGFLWHALLHFQIDVFLYLATQLTVRLDDDLVDRAWNQVCCVYSFHPELYDLSNKTHHTLARFIIKGWRKRAEMIYNKTGQVPATLSCVEHLQSIMPSEDIKAEPEPVAPVGNGVGLLGPQMDVDMDMDFFNQGTGMGPFMGDPQLDLDMSSGMPSGLLLPHDGQPEFLYSMNAYTNAPTAWF